MIIEKISESIKKGEMKMNKFRIYNWLKKLDGEVTIEELLAQFPHATPIEIAEGFSKFIDMQSKIIEKQMEGR